MPSYSSSNVDTGRMSREIGSALVAIRGVGKQIKAGAKTARKNVTDGEFWFGSLATADFGRETFGEALGEGGSLREISDAVGNLRLEVSSEETDRAGSFRTGKRLSAEFTSDFGSFTVF